MRSDLTLSEGEYDPQHAPSDCSPASCPLLVRHTEQRAVPRVPCCHLIDMPTKERGSLARPTLGTRCSPVPRPVRAIRKPSAGHSRIGRTGLQVAPPVSICPHPYLMVPYHSTHGAGRKRSRTAFNVSRRESRSSENCSHSSRVCCPATTLAQNSCCKSRKASFESRN